MVSADKYVVVRPLTSVALSRSVWACGVVEEEGIDAEDICLAI